MHHLAKLAVSALLLSGSAIAPLRASALLAEYSGSYSILAVDTASEPVVALRLTLGPQFADCDVAGACLSLALLEGLGAGQEGAVYALNHAGEAGGLLLDGSEDLFWLSMNFGSVYSAAAGGGVGIYESVLSGYPPADIDAITLTVDRLLFDVAPGPYGPASQARLAYTLSVYGTGVVADVDEQTAPPSFLVATPEPATWLLLACGLAGVWGLSRRL